MRLENVAVIGAGGKMGRGIALVLLQKLSEENTPFKLHLIDLSEERLETLRPYFREHLKRYGEKNIIALRKKSSCVSNLEVIEEYVTRGMDRIYLHTQLESCFQSTHIFEAIVENVETKVDLFSTIRKKSSCDPLFLTNTSSIPIHLLNEKANLGGRIIGFHFYNPPAVQKLVELIGNGEGEALASFLGKTVVHSKDEAGFIGNGHFIRELNFAARQLEKFSPAEIDFVTREYLLRPMGIFELLDYVGYDVAENICSIMNEQLGENFQLPPNWKRDNEQVSFSLPDGHKPFKIAKRGIDLRNYLETLFSSDEKGASLAVSFLKNSKKIAEELVERGVANSLSDVSLVLKNGFHHLYGVEEIPS